MEKEIRNKISDKVVIEEKKMNRPRLTIGNIPTYINTEEQLIDTLHKQNKIINASFSKEEMETKLKIKTHLSNKYNKETKRIILEVSAKLRRILIKEKLNIKWRRTEAKDYLTLLQCYKCCEIGHTSKKCTKLSNTCGRCAEDHCTKDCKNEKEVCIICKLENDKYKKNHDVYHRCNEESCPIIKRIKKNIQKNINYDE